MTSRRVVEQNLLWIKDINIFRGKSTYTESVRVITHPVISSNYIWNTKLQVFRFRDVFFQIAKVSQKVYPVWRKYVTEICPQKCDNVTKMWHIIKWSQKYVKCDENMWRKITLSAKFELCRRKTFSHWPKT